MKIKLTVYVINCLCKNLLIFIVYFNAKKETSFPRIEK